MKQLVPSDKNNFDISKRIQIFDLKWKFIGTIHLNGTKVLYLSKVTHYLNAIIVIIKIINLCPIDLVNLRIHKIFNICRFKLIFMNEKFPKYKNQRNIIFKIFAVINKNNISYSI